MMLSKDKILDLMKYGKIVNLKSEDISDSGLITLNSSTSFLLESPFPQSVDLNNSFETSPEFNPNFKKIELQYSGFLLSPGIQGILISKEKFDLKEDYLIKIEDILLDIFTGVTRVSFSKGLGGLMITVRNNYVSHAIRVVSGAPLLKISLQENFTDEL